MENSFFSSTFFTERSIFSWVKPFAETFMQTINSINVVNFIARKKDFSFGDGAKNVRSAVFSFLIFLNA